MELGLQRESNTGNATKSVVSETARPNPSRSLARPSARFAFVDGLRGFAALAIVIFHIWWYEPDPQPALESAHWMIDATFLRVRGGVQVLLVISGFVIAYTLRRTWVTPVEVFSFIGRRLIRLVPTYWVAIATVILVDAICQNALGLSSPFEGDVTLSRVSAHMTFLQDVFGHDPLGAGMWTLCIEMQFYVVAVLGLGFAQRILTKSSANDPRPSAAGLMVVFAPVALISLFHWRSMASTDVWVTHFLWMFFLGMTTWWSLDTTLPLPFFAATVCVALIELYFDAEWRYENTVALTTAISIFIAGRCDKLGVWLNWPWLQHIGKISYSLYLIHFPVCHLLMATGWNWFGNDPTSLQAMLIMATAFVASLVAGHLIYLMVEAPSARWAARTKAALA